MTFNVDEYCMKILLQSKRAFPDSVINSAVSFIS